VFEPGVDGVTDVGLVFREMRAALRDSGARVDMGMGHDDAIDLMIDAADAQLRGRMGQQGDRQCFRLVLMRHESNFLMAGSFSVVFCKSMVYIIDTKSNKNRSLVH